MRPLNKKVKCYLIICTGICKQIYLIILIARHSRRVRYILNSFYAENFYKYPFLNKHLAWKSCFNSIIPDINKI